MNVRVEVQFEELSADNEESVASVAFGLTDDESSVKVYRKSDTDDWLIAEFTMPTEAQYKAVDTIDRSIRFSLWQRMESTICFPKSEAEQASARRKNESRKAQRKMRG